MKNVPQNGGGVPENATNVPAFGNDHPRALPEELSFDALIAQVEAAEATSEWWFQWTRDIVEARLKSAIKLMQRTTGRVGPKGYGSAMPAYLYSEIDLWYQQTQEEEERRKGDHERNRVHLAATTRDIAMMEEALDWPRRYVANEVVRASLHLWLLSCAVRVPFKRVLKGKGIAQRTGIHRRDRAIALVVYGLVLDKVPVRE